MVLYPGSLLESKDAERTWHGFFESTGTMATIYHTREDEESIRDRAHEGDIEDFTHKW